MNFMMKFFFVIFLIILAIQLSIQISFESNTNRTTIYNSSYDQLCSEDYECEETLVCKNLHCKCPIGEIWSKDDHQCVSFGDGSCDESIECQDQDPNRICDDEECECRYGYHEYMSLCRSDDELSTSSTTTQKPGSYDESCKYNKCDSSKRLVCKGNLCKCAVGHIWSENYQKCVEFKNGKCYSDYECQDYDLNRVCSNYKCQCKSGFKYSMSSWSLCRKVIGSYCYANNQCNDYMSNSICYSNECTCQLFYSESFDSTECRSTNCQADYDCRFRLGGISYPTESYCYYGHCRCKDGYKYTNSSCIKVTTSPPSIHEEHSLYKFSYYHFFWLLLIIPLVGLFCCIRLCYQRSVYNQRMTRSNQSDQSEFCGQILSVDALLITSNYAIADPSAPLPSAPPSSRPPSYQEAVAPRIYPNLNQNNF